MKGNALNYLNIFLILLSLVIAFNVPIELFLFSYAVLGPLHYLTEISWLKKRNFFTTGKKDWLVLLSTTSIYIICYFLLNLSNSQEYGAGLREILGESGNEILRNTVIFMTFISLMMGIAMAAFKQTKYKLLFIGVSASLGFFLSGMPNYVVLFAILLPTIIHVLVFTGIFMLYGALKSRSKSGVVTFIIFVLAAAMALLFRKDDPTYFQELSTGAAESFQVSGFTSLWETIRNWFVVYDDQGTAIEFPAWANMGSLRIIAFAYTYHYLNWFSKTSVIGWHKIPKRNLMIVFAIWIAAIALYWYDYKVGLMALLFLSVLHVFLEFPLNYHSFVGIGKEGWAWYKGTPVATTNPTGKGNAKGKRKGSRKK